MKIISGKYKGRILEGYDIKGTRPTMDRIKESLFAMIQDYIEGSIVLDLFAGSASLGIEALSLNAKYAYLVDKNPKCTSLIKKNITKINIPNVKVYNSDYKLALKKLSEENVKLDLIFLDPPYDTDLIEKSINLIEMYNLLSDKGIIVCESNGLDKIVYNDNYEVLKNKKYQDKWVVILHKM